MIRPISVQIAPSIASTFSDVSPIKSNVSLLSRSSLSSHCGSSLSILNCFTSAWQWIKTYIFCCFSKASQESSETTDTCPIPVITEGDWFNKEINKQIRDLHELEIPNQPDWAAFPKDAALFFQDISEEIDTRDADSPDLDLEDRINTHFTFPGIVKAMDCLDSNERLPKETTPFLYSFFVIFLCLGMKNSMIDISIEDATFQDPLQPDANCAIPLLTEGTWLELEMNRNLSSLSGMEIKNHPEWALYPQSLALFFSRIAQEIDSGEFTSDKPLDELNFDNRIKAIPFHKKVENVLDLNYFKVVSDEIDNLPLYHLYIKTLTGLVVKSKMVQQAQQQ